MNSETFFYFMFTFSYLDNISLTSLGKPTKDYMTPFNNYLLVLGSEAVAIVKDSIHTVFKEWNERFHATIL